MSHEKQPAENSPRQAKRAYWSQHVKTWQKSGLTQVRYCQQHQLNQQTFTYWKVKLQKQAALSHLLPVSIKPDRNQTSSFLHSGIVLSFNDRLSIQLENGFNDDTLSRLIDLLERRR